MYTSLLFVPGDSQRKLEKSCTVAADVIIPDLEDSVALIRKEEACKITAAMVPSLLAAGKQVFVRVNALDTGRTEADLMKILPAEPTGVVLPKCNGPEDLAQLSALLTKHELTERKGATKIIAIATETPEGVLALTRPGWASPRLSGLMWGAEDLAAELGATRNFNNGAYTDPFKMVRNLCLIAARAAGVIPIDTIYADFKDEAGLSRLTEEASADGFEAKAAIHPAQLPIIIAAFRPSAAEIEWAKSVIQAFEGAQAGVASLDGKMLDMPHLRSARKILARAG